MGPRSTPATGKRTAKTAAKKTAKKRTRAKSKSARTKSTPTKRKPTKRQASRAKGLGSDLREIEDSVSKLLTDLTGEVTGGALRLAARVGGVPLEVARALVPGADQLNPLDPERLEMMRNTGLYLRELRELAGLTVSDLRDALELSDSRTLEAVENGTATLSFELILRLAALLARHDPIPFVIRFTRTYNPEIWQILEGWGIGRIPTQYERERQFLNIFRSEDSARRLSDEGFDKVLEFTRAAFDLSLHFVAQDEGVRSKRRRRKRESTAKATPP